MKHKKFDFRTAYIDLLLNVLTGIIFLFILTTLLINPPKKAQDDGEGIKRIAEYIITVAWDPNVDCDIDMWVEDPLGNLASFRTQSVGLMTIERDDMGFKNDFIYDTTGKLVLQSIENKEIWTLRGKQLGEFTLNLHLYSCRIDKVPMQLGQQFDVPVMVEFIKINPSYEVIRRESVLMDKIWKEETVYKFELRDNALPIFKKEFKKLVKDKKSP